MVYRPENRWRSCCHGGPLFSRLARAPSDHTESLSHLAIVRLLKRACLALAGRGFTFGRTLRAAALGAYGAAPFAASGRSSSNLAGCASAPASPRTTTRFRARRCWPVPEVARSTQCRPLADASPGVLVVDGRDAVRMACPRGF